MLNLTDSAAGHLATILEQAPDEAAVRFVPQGNALSMQLDNPRPEDVTFEHNDRTVLVLDPQISEVLSDRTLDVQETPQGPQLALS